MNYEENTKQRVQQKHSKEMKMHYIRNFEIIAKQFQIRFEEIFLLTKKKFSNLTMEMHNSIDYKVIFETCQQY